MTSLVWWAAFGLLGASSAAADWLITLEGRLIETQGPWTIEGENLTYTDVEGKTHTLSLSEVDLEASEETTALRSGRPYTPPEKSPPPPPPPRPKGKRSAKAKKTEAKIILYTDAFCPNCTAARQLLEELGAPFVEKSISQDRRAFREYRKKAGRGGGVPVIDIDGKIIFRYDPRLVRRGVEEFLKREESENSQEKENARGGGR